MKTLLTTAGLLLSLVSVSQAAPVTVNWQFADEMFTRVNAIRTANGLPTFGRVFNAELTASLHSLDMARRNYQSHTTAPASGPVYPGYPYYLIPFYGGNTLANRLDACHYYDYSGAAENLIAGSGLGSYFPEAAVDWWMSSPLHAANILNPNYAAIGVGCAVSTNGTVYAVLIFANTTAGYWPCSSNLNIWQG